MTRSQFERLFLADKASKELLKYIEDLLEPIRIEVPNKHLPVRRALFWFDPERSVEGNFIPFPLFKEAIEHILKDEKDLLDRIVPFESDPENDGFAQIIDNAKVNGMSEQDALKSVSGADNLELLGKGMIPGFINLIESIAPDLGGGLDGLKVQSQPIQDYLDAGQPGASKEVLGPIKDRIKNIAKSSLGMENARRNEEEKSANKIVNYATGVATAKTSEYSPARIWHLWALYPQLKKVDHEIELIKQDAKISPSNGTIKVDGNTVDTVFEDNLSRINTSIRYAAVMISSSPSNALICCAVGALIELPELKSYIQSFEAILETGIRLNELNLRFNIPSYADLGNSLVRMTATRVAAKLDENFQTTVDFLRRSFDRLKDLIGDDDLSRCFLLDNLFDAMLGIMKQLKKLGNQRLRLLLDQIKIEGQNTNGMNLSLMDNIVLGNLQFFLGEMKRLSDFIDSCELGDSAIRRRGLDLIDRIARERSGFKVHVRGQPLPEGLDPRSPLANLDPVATTHGILHPGIQGNDLPTGELEELFDLCRSGGLGGLENVELLRAIVKRK